MFHCRVNVSARVQSVSGSPIKPTVKVTLVKLNCNLHDPSDELSANEKLMNVNKQEHLFVEMFPIRPLAVGVIMQH